MKETTSIEIIGKGSFYNYFVLYELLYVLRIMF